MNNLKMGIVLIIVGSVIAMTGAYIVYSQKSTATIETKIVSNTSAAPISTQDNQRKGHDFEKYVVGLFDKDSLRFKLKEWRGDKIADNGVYAENNKYPDLEYEFVGDNKNYRFAVECKWRSKFYNGTIDWARPAQIQNYLEYEKKNRAKVFVVIGIGGMPSAPAEMYVTPLQNISPYPTLFESYLKQYKRNPTYKFFFTQHNQLLN